MLAARTNSELQLRGEIGKCSAATPGMNALHSPWTNAANVTDVQKPTRARMPTESLRVLCCGQHIPHGDRDCLECQPRTCLHWLHTHCRSGPLWWLTEGDCRHARGMHGLSSTDARRASCVRRMSLRPSRQSFPHSQQKP